MRRKEHLVRHIGIAVIGIMAAGLVAAAPAQAASVDDEPWYTCGSFEYFGGGVKASGCVGSKDAVVPDVPKGKEYNEEPIHTSWDVKIGKQRFGCTRDRWGGWGWARRYKNGMLQVAGEECIEGKSSAVFDVRARS